VKIDERHYCLHLTTADGELLETWIVSWAAFQRPHSDNRPLAAVRSRIEEVPGVFSTVADLIAEAKG